MHPRRGYRFIHALLVQEGQHLNRKKVRRIWRRKPCVSKRSPAGKSAPGRPSRCRPSSRTTSGRMTSSSTRPWEDKR
ncbi:IS3 family transposase [Deinococcus hopiensis]|uniref:IS3 family transposase n=1 Tax=Deinococcus hopiensis TaxID=309885 RepID=UPI003CCB8B3B